MPPPPVPPSFPYGPDEATPSGPYVEPPEDPPSLPAGLTGTVPAFEYPAPPPPPPTYKEPNPEYPPPPPAALGDPVPAPPLPTIMVCENGPERGVVPVLYPPAPPPDP